MKRPASVLATLIVFGFFILMGIMVVVKNSPSDVGSFLAAAIMPFLFLIGWVGVYLAKNWARIYSSCLIVLIGLLFVFLPYFIGEEQSKNSEFIIFKIFSFALFSWWAYSLSLGKASKEYFSSGANA